MLLVTGATGYVGSAALRLLSTSSGSGAVVGLARNAERVELSGPKGVAFRIADYEDRQSLDKAFEGVTGLLFVASDGAGPAVVRQHAHVIGGSEIRGRAYCFHEYH